MFYNRFYCRKQEGFKNNEELCKINRYGTKCLFRGLFDCNQKTFFLEQFQVTFTSKFYNRNTIFFISNYFCTNMF